ncbi:transmembrane protein 231 [Hyposmocoma kahamanoa]|uniref:transmembrane protein 231 n=1 Tax=Hyposmocoma kahamanoa TaxID=1477025 RepID=UPI000E6D7130|nr:transmembrane protein 231 [Hyposmocoma kahamanoa]
MKMGLYKLFSCNLEVQYKSYFLSKAMLFTILTTVLTIILPFVLAYRSRGFWLKSHVFYEQPKVHFTYEYLLFAETEDPSHPVVCGEAAVLEEEGNSEENCAEIQVQCYDYNQDGKNDIIDLKFRLNIPSERTVASVTIILALDFQVKSVCPLHMQSLAVITEQFPVPPSGLKYYGDLQLYQIAHLPCLNYHMDTKYNKSLFDELKKNGDNIVDSILEQYYSREVTTESKTIHSRSQNGHTGSMFLQTRLRVPEMHILYKPSLLQELKWAWPQYLSIVVIFHWLFNKIKRFVFHNRLVMAWEVIPSKKH